MKTVVRITIAVAVMLMMSLSFATSSDARGGHGPRVGVGLWVGPGWWGPHYYPPYYPYYYPYYPYYPSEPPIIIQQQPEMYIQPAPQEQQPTYWYFCKDPQGYYPYVKECPSGWMRVVPTPPAPGASPP